MTYTMEVVCPTYSAVEIREWGDQGQCHKGDVRVGSHRMNRSSPAGELGKELSIERKHSVGKTQWWKMTQGGLERGSGLVELRKRVRAWGELTGKVNQSDGGDCVHLKQGFPTDGLLGTEPHSRR